MPGIVDFLNKMKSVIERSYQVEFAGVDKASAKGQEPGLFGDANSPAVIYRAALFTEVKDAYDALNKKDKLCIDFLVRKKYSNTDTLSAFIDSKVGGPDGLGGCLQDATFSLLQLHKTIIEEFELEDQCEKAEDNIDVYRTMPKLEISVNASNEAKIAREEKPDDEEAGENFKPLF